MDLRQSYPSLAYHVEEHYLRYCPPEYHSSLTESGDLQVDYTDWLSGRRALPHWLGNVVPYGDELQLLDRAKGSLVGLAVADAVGTTLEFLPRDLQHVSDIVGGGPFRLKPGEWTDDTSMALCLAETYIQAGHLDITSFRNRLVNWYHFGVNSANGVCFDIGNTTRYALEQYLDKGPSWFGNTESDTAGNAAIIRQAPAGIFQRHSLLRSLYDGEKQGLATHGAIESLDASRLMAYILYQLLNGADKAKALSPAMLPLNARCALINAGEYKNKQRDEIRSSGYVIDTLEAALWAVWQTDNFHDAVLLAANLADDADSVAATAGQIAGALYGYKGIPERWREKLVEEPRICMIAEQLFLSGPKV
ncbi:ADP-ribosylarginine hydrolase Tri1 [Erwinia sp. LJJL01]|uniref:ADP-ribosylarginine hydrolase Tri1 n=1 Tax=Erwinia TaxID=551 RepID=UPI0010DB223A|nr:ADP-ribosylarginine hydrolase Tri1 [Erwinia aphidicola]MCP2231917.1 ADP-ribosylglycohydrolase [Erwinia aphidicola]